MSDEQINAAISEYTGVHADYLSSREAQQQAHRIMAFKTCRENSTAEDKAVWDEYGVQLFKHGMRINELSDYQWAEAYLCAIGKWKEAQP